MVGTIALVGAGLGDPELLTVKALRKIKEADVVVYDRLINPAILNECKVDCEKIYVGKMPDHHPVPQEKIEEIIVAQGLAGKKVVRLKSGDPYVFGRGGEEGASLRKAGVPFEVIPGITSSIGGLAYAGIPVTDRELASSFHVYTGHLKSSENQIDFAAAAKTEGTLVFLMGMSGLQEIASQLITHGKDPETPAAIVQWASRKQQKTVVGTLATIYDRAKAAEMKPPSLIVIGEVVTRRPTLDFFEERPLFGHSITLPYAKGKNFSSRLTDLGAEVVELPPTRIRIHEVTEDLMTLRQVVFTDKAAVAAFIEKMAAEKLDWRRLTDLELLTVGHHTATALQQAGIYPDQRFTDLAELVAQAELASDSLILGEEAILAQLPESLAGKGQVSHSEAIEGTIPDLWQETDLLLFPNSKGARMFVQALTETQLTLLQTKTIVVMGAQTQAVFRERSIPVITSGEPNFDSVLTTIKKELDRP